MRDILIRVDICTLPSGSRAALLQVSDPDRTGLAGARFVARVDHDTEGQFRAATADALAQLLDETL